MLLAFTDFVPSAFGFTRSPHAWDHALMVVLMRWLGYGSCFFRAGAKLRFWIERTFGWNTLSAYHCGSWSQKKSLWWDFTHWLYTGHLPVYWWAISRPTFGRVFRCCSGYKEFDAYLTSPTDLLFREAVDLMKLSTRQYAKKQISWMRNKLLPAVLQANAEELTTPLYLLDATGLWIFLCHDISLKLPKTWVKIGFPTSANLESR